MHGPVSVSAPARIVNRVIKEARALGFVTTLYRVIASLAGCGAVWGADRGGTPLAGIASASDSLGIPSGWTATVAGWIAERSDLVENVALLMVCVGLLTLPKPRYLGGTLEWRGPSTTVLALAALAQCGHFWRSLLFMVPVVAFGIAVAGHERGGDQRWERVGVGVWSVFLALVFVPLYAFSWLFSRDVRPAALAS